jgi:hypothetical protein
VTAVLPSALRFRVWFQTTWPRYSGRLRLHRPMTDSSRPGALAGVAGTAPVQHSSVLRCACSRCLPPRARGCVSRWERQRPDAHREFSGNPTLCGATSAESLEEKRGDEPDPLDHLSGAGSLAGEDLARIDFATGGCDETYATVRCSVPDSRWVDITGCNTAYAAILR